jgi:hypothetical protein
MINVLFGFMPLYVETFTDLGEMEAAIDRIIPLTRWVGHWLNPEVFISFDALLIVLLQAVISYLTRRWHDQRVARAPPSRPCRGSCRRCRPLRRRRRQDRDLVDRRDDLLGAVLRVLRHDRSARPGGGLSASPSSPSSSATSPGP